MLLISMEIKNNSLSLRAMQTCNDLLVARGQNGLEKQAVEKRSSRTVLLASCVTTITARIDCDDKESWTLVTSSR